MIFAEAPLLHVQIIRFRGPHRDETTQAYLCFPGRIDDIPQKLTREDLSLFWRYGHIARLVQKLRKYRPERGRLRRVVVYGH
jgi:hypothetical protein